MEQIPLYLLLWVLILSMDKGVSKLKEGKYLRGCMFLAVAKNVEEGI
jgi:hypothetical protein